MLEPCKSEGELHVLKLWHKSCGVVVTGLVGSLPGAFMHLSTGSQNLNVADARVKDVRKQCMNLKCSKGE